MKRAIVTGATGAIGAALIKELISKNIEVLVFCRKESKRNFQIPSHGLVTRKFCSLEQLATMENDVNKEYDVFYHLAWKGTTGKERNDMYLQNKNIQYALDAVKVARRFGCKKFIGAGSQAEYGRVNGMIKADTPAFPETGYGIAKLCAGQMTRELSHQYHMQHNWVRILSVYGPNDSKQSMVISTIEKLKNNEVAKFTKGEQKWDYLYSSDAAHAFFRIGNQGVDGKVYVLGSGKARPLSEYIYEIKRIVNPNGKIELGAIPYGPKQVMYLCADTRELEKDVGWKANVDFTSGIEKILNGENK